MTPLESSLRDEAERLERNKARRRDLWCGVAIAVAGDTNCLNKFTPCEWADAAVDRFDIAFPDTEV